ncbi:hypothetical protein CspeluHIS016_0303410 [Cutaneotrichosporon spelunceum]|uniref:Cyanovirin-N domain-containing protein n=1 Tax=Cutaneotrichosporon spelunceum TaxID=1672016 RepID=A0AAD3TTA2_9TREE|nr:hypothetical protein CspeluHIS016_0303410 [Cutaneotrichosporon spelunceum]
MISFTLVTLLASNAALAAPLEPRKDQTQIQSRTSNTRVGNLCLAAGGENNSQLILKSCADKDAGARAIDSHIVLSTGGLAEVDLGEHSDSFVYVRGDVNEPAQGNRTFRPANVEGYVRFQTLDWQCLTVDGLLPGPAKLRMTPCQVPSVMQDFMLI